MVAGVRAIRFFLLVEVKAYIEVFTAELRIQVEARVAGRCKRANKAHFFTIFVLKSIAGAPEKVGGIVGDGENSELHIF